PSLPSPPPILSLLFGLRPDRGKGTSSPRRALRWGIEPVSRPLVSTSWPRTARLAVIASAALAVLLFAPTAARASCGRQVVLTGKSSAAPEATQERAPPQHGPFPLAPCHGPGCSRAPDGPPLVPPAPPSSAAGLWGDLVGRLALPQAEA